MRKSTCSALSIHERPIPGARVEGEVADGCRIYGPGSIRGVAGGSEWYSEAKPVPKRSRQRSGEPRSTSSRARWTISSKGLKAGRSWDEVKGKLARAAIPFRERPATEVSIARAIAVTPEKSSWTSHLRLDRSQTQDRRANQELKSRYNHPCPPQHAQAAGSRFHRFFNGRHREGIGGVRSHERNLHQA